VPRWVPWEGAYRAAGEGPLGLHQGSLVWTLDAALDRQKALAATIPRTWVEAFTDGTWRRVTKPVELLDPPA
jgi:hypothetical protein